MLAQMNDYLKEITSSFNQGHVCIASSLPDCGCVAVRVPPPRRQLAIFVLVEDVIIKSYSNENEIPFIEKDQDPNISNNLVDNYVKDEELRGTNDTDEEYPTKFERRMATILHRY